MRPLLTKNNYLLIMITLFFTLFLSTQNILFFTHNFHNITVREYLLYSVSPPLSLHEYNVGVCQLYRLSDEPINVFTLYSSKGLWGECRWFSQPAHVQH